MRRKSGVGLGKSAIHAPKPEVPQSRITPSHNFQTLYVMMELYLKTLLSTYDSAADEVVIVFDNARRNSRTSRIESSSSNVLSSSSHQPQEVSRKRDRWSRDLKRHKSDSCLEIPNRNSKKNEDRLSSSDHDYPRTSSNDDIYGIHHKHVSVGSPRRNRNMRWRMDEAYSPRSPEEEQNSIYSIRKSKIKEYEQPIRAKDIALHVPMRLMSPAAHQAIRKVGSIRLQHHQRAMFDTELHVPMRFQSPQSTVSKNVRRKVQVKKGLSELDDSTHIQHERMDPNRHPKCAALALDTRLHVPIRFQSPQSTRPTIVSKNVRRKIQVKKGLSELDDSTHIQRERMDPNRRPKCAALAA